ncbi:hypothetical protein [Plasmodium yoelii yoelii]|uniref:Uncharacterized protein n=1 Tax=Plasmodium yoelii yoelii TaxID=73239 RepID=Q7RSI4_PLAYO|nr:hypothetical protein [Plasmodium yoelii yoelii]
MNIYYYISVI